MNADKFYDAMKDALQALDLRWSEKDQMTIRVIDGTVIFSGNDRSYTVRQSALR